MFFDSAEQIPEIAEKTGFSVFVLKEAMEIKIKNAIYLRPDERTNKISIESVRNLLTLTSTKKTKPQFFIIESPETMSAEAANAFLKNLEEPKENYHFVFLTKNLSLILPTILSRAQIYFEKNENFLNTPPNFDEKTMDYAKKLIVATESKLPALAKEISDKKNRNFAIEIVAAAIEISYKSFFKTGDIKFLKKLPNLIELHENITANGNLKLHFVADML